jgi:gamma-tubulin complex component 3
MVHQWIYKGELQDPYSEFFVLENTGLEKENYSNWKNKYSFDEKMVPSLISKELAYKAFLIGKSLNYIKNDCGDKEFLDSHLDMKESLQYGDLVLLEHSIDKAYKASSKHLLKLFFEKFKFNENLLAIKKYLLLAQGDFVQSLMDCLGNALSKHANSIYRHNLTGTLETAIRSSNAQFECEDVLKHLDVRLLQVAFS